VGSGQWANSLTEYVDAVKASGRGRGVLNLSFDLTQVNGDGTISARYEFTDEERAALGYARENNVLIVAAAGNDAGIMSVLGQASQEFENILTVGAADGNTRASYSNYGFGLDILAPGGTADSPIMSTVGNGIGTMVGTSVAAAQVTAAAATVWGANPGLNRQQVIDILKATATDLEAAGWDEETGFGLLNIERAVELAKRVDPATAAPLAAFATPLTWGGEGEVIPLERAVNWETDFVGRIASTVGVNVRSSPQIRPDNIIGSRGAGESVRFTRWTYGDSVTALGLGTEDKRWYYDAEKGGWIAAGLVYGDALGSTPLPQPGTVPVTPTPTPVVVVPPSSPVQNPFYPVWQQYLSTLGNPTSGVLVSNGSRYQLFEGGSIVSSSFGTFPLYGGIRGQYLEQGGLAGWLGAPKSGEIGLGNGRIIQYFEGGHILWDGSSAVAHRPDGSQPPVPGTVVPPGSPVQAPFYSVWQRYQSTLGNPTSGVQVFNGSRYQYFERGSIVSSPFGTFPVYGNIRQSYRAIGGLNSWLGAPRSEEMSQGNGTTIQYFAGGYISWNGSRATPYQTGPVSVPRSGNNFPSLISNPTPQNPLRGFLHPLGGAGTITQGNGGATSHFGLQQYALDFGVPIGTPVYAMRAGRVVGIQQAYPDTGGGPANANRFNYVLVEHEGGYRSAYVHLQQGFNNRVGLSVGSTVNAGQLIGYSGNSGWSTGPHLHVEVHRPTAGGFFGQTVPFVIGSLSVSPPSPGPTPPETPDPIASNDVNGSRSTATNIGDFSGVKFFFRPDSITKRIDDNDFFKITTDKRTNLRIEVSGLSSDLDLELLNERGELIINSANSGSENEFINRIIESGIYFIKVHGSNERSSSSYDLRINSVPLSGTITNLGLSRFQGSLVNDDDRFYYNDGVSIYRYNKDGRIFDGISGNKNTAIIIHGWKNDDESPEIVKLSKTVAEKFPDMQVLALNWKKPAEDLRDNLLAQNNIAIPYHSARSIAPVSEWLATTLTRLGVKANQLNLIGHSLGSYVAAETGRRLNGIRSIVALDPAYPATDYDIDGNQVDSQPIPLFNAIAGKSTAMVASDERGGYAGDNDRAATADNSFIIRFADSRGLALVDGEYHGGVVSVFTSLIANNQLGLSGYDKNRFTGDGYSPRSEPADHEGVINAVKVNGSWQVVQQPLSFVYFSGSNSVTWI
jgi:pimeloyl-ACP methyl ester carboxylesterase